MLMTCTGTISPISHHNYICIHLKKITNWRQKCFKHVRRVMVKWCMKFVISVIWVNGETSFSWGQCSILNWAKENWIERSEFTDISSFGKEGRECKTDSSYIHVDILMYICVNIRIFGTWAKTLIPHVSMLQNNISAYILYILNGKLNKIKKKPVVFHVVFLHMYVPLC